ncbi:hypothetical protein VULLAG_LOCUS9559 [Vulpes lagopus]
MQSNGKSVPNLENTWLAYAVGFELFLLFILMSHFLHKNFKRCCVLQRQKYPFLSAFSPYQHTGEPLCVYLVPVPIKQNTRRRTFGGMTEKTKVVPPKMKA